MIGVANSLENNGVNPLRPTTAIFAEGCGRTGKAMKNTPFAKWVRASGIGIILALALGLPQTSEGAVERFKFPSGNNYLILELLNDDLVHFELSALGPGPALGTAIFTTPQVYKTSYTGPTAFAQSGANGNTLDTPHMKVAVDPASLCFTVTDKTKSQLLTTLCPLNLPQAWKGLTLAPAGMQHVYGLGEQFIQSGNPNGDWTAPGRQQRTPGDNFGNQMTGFGGGANGNAQIPVMYALGPNGANYALFLDQIYKQSWDFGGNPWKVEMWGDQIRGYLMTGQNLPALRQAYMDLTGHPPVPPKKMFGLWISEYGFHEWAEIDGKLGNLRADQFPVDGFVLDVQWFGGVSATGTNPSRMGSLTFDPVHFSNPAGKLADYQNSKGIGIMVIEESYVDQSLPEHADLKSRQYLVKQCQNGPNQTCNPRWTALGALRYLSAPPGWAQSA
jgi:alpha-glucosidase (family GH31 glycosyl hydrolase)